MMCTNGYPEEFWSSTKSVGQEWGQHCKSVTRAHGNEARLYPAQMAIGKEPGSRRQPIITGMDCHRQRVKLKGADTDADWTVNSGWLNSSSQDSGRISEIKSPAVRRLHNLAMVHRLLRSPAFSGSAPEDSIMNSVSLWVSETFPAQVLDRQPNTHNQVLPPVCLCRFWSCVNAFSTPPFLASQLNLLTSLFHP
jgi:hypothetical protein